MRVGLFTNAYRPLISGVVNSIELIRKELLRQGHVPFIFAPRVSGYGDQHAGVHRFPSLDLLSNVRFPLALPCWPPSHCAIGRRRLEVVHAHHPFWLGDVAWWWARRLRAPLVYTFHTQYEQYCHYLSLPQRPLRALTRAAVSQFARRCDLIIAPSPIIRELMGEYGIRTWTETLPNAIDLSRFQTLSDRSQQRRRLGWPQEAVIGMYAGRLGKEKNLHFLLQAVARQAEAVCAVVGDGAELPALKALAVQLGIADRVIFTGQVDYVRMPDYYAAADFFCISSTTEVKPLVVLEALAAGLPVLAVSACGTQDTLHHGHDGLLTPHDLEAFSAGWRQMSNPESRLPLAQNARKTASAYAIEPYTRRLVELYAEARRRLAG